MSIQILETFQLKFTNNHTSEFNKEKHVPINLKYVSKMLRN